VPKQNKSGEFNQKLLSYYIKYIYKLKIRNIFVVQFDDGKLKRLVHSKLPWNFYHKDSTNQLYMPNWLAHLFNSNYNNHSIILDKEWHWHLISKTIREKLQQEWKWKIILANIINKHSLSYMTSMFYIFIQIKIEITTFLCKLYE